MIKVIKNATEKEKVFNTDCQHCGSKIEYATSDLILDDETGNLGFTCPVCGSFHVERYGNPFQFPEAFYHVSSAHGAVEVTKEKTQKMIDDCVSRLIKSSEDDDYVYTATGDTMVLATKCDGEITVCVVKDYYETETYIN